MTRTPELVLDPSEARQLSGPLAELNRLYPTTIDPRVLAWLSFVSVGAMVYGPRIYAISDRHKREREERRKKADVISPTEGLSPDASSYVEIVGGFQPPPEAPFATSQN